MRHSATSPLESASATSTECPPGTHATADTASSPHRSIGGASRVPPVARLHERPVSLRPSPTLPSDATHHTATVPRWSPAARSTLSPDARPRLPPDRLPRCSTESSRVEWTATEGRCRCTEAVAARARCRQQRRGRTPIPKKTPRKRRRAKESAKKHAPAPAKRVEARECWARGRRPLSHARRLSRACRARTCRRTGAPRRRPCRWWRGAPARAATPRARP